jgi:hypothetical protein
MNHNFDTELCTNETESRPRIRESRVASYIFRVRNTTWQESLCSKIFEDIETEKLAKKINLARNEHAL